MIDIDTFLTYLCVVVDDFYKQYPSCEHNPGPSASLGDNGTDNGVGPA